MPLWGQNRLQCSVIDKLWVGNFFFLNEKKKKRKQIHIFIVEHNSYIHCWTLFLSWEAVWLISKTIVLDIYVIISDTFTSHYCTHHQTNAHLHTHTSCPHPPPYITLHTNLTNDIIMFFQAPLLVTTALMFLAVELLSWDLMVAQTLTLMA